MIISAIVACGNFNPVDTKLFQHHYGLKQILKRSTQKIVILDLILAYLHVHEHFQVPITFPQFGLSDRYHNSILICPKI